MATTIFSNVNAIRLVLFLRSMYQNQTILEQVKLIFGNLYQIIGKLCWKACGYCFETKLNKNILKEVKLNRKQFNSFRQREKNN